VSTTPGSEEPPRPPPPPASHSESRLFTGRAAFAIAQIYYYGAAVVGVGFVIGGAIALLIGLRQLALPGESDTTRESVRLMLQGLAWGVPGFAFAWWHLHEARSREGRLTPGAFWGRSLYFHLVSFIAAVTVLGAVTAGLYALIDAAYAPECPDVLGVAGFCAGAAESLRAAVNAAIVVLVAGRSGGGTFVRRVARPPTKPQRAAAPSRSADNVPIP
jgi:hypothetical protein